MLKELIEKFVIEKYGCSLKCLPVDYLFYDLREEFFNTESDSLTESIMRFLFEAVSDYRDLINPEGTVDEFMKNLKL